MSHATPAPGPQHASEGTPAQLLFPYLPQHVLGRSFLIAEGQPGLLVKQSGAISVLSAAGDRAAGASPCQRATASAAGCSERHGPAERGPAWPSEGLCSVYDRIRVRVGINAMAAEMALGTLTHASRAASRSSCAPNVPRLEPCSRRAADPDSSARAACCCPHGLTSPGFWTCLSMLASSALYSRPL